MELKLTITVAILMLYTVRQSVLHSTILRVGRAIQRAPTFDGDLPSFDFSSVEVLLRPAFRGNGYCPNETVFYIIRSHPDRWQARQLIRITWAATLKGSLIFVLGNSRAGEIRHDILEESKRYDDILLVDMIDTYRNLTIKSVSILRWIDRYCNAPKFFFQGDLDVAAFPDQISSFFSKQDAALPRIYGRCWKNARVVRESSSKWQISQRLYIPSTYPLYVAGASWIFSASTVPPLLKELAIPRSYFHVDDTLISGVLAEKADIPRICLNSIGYLEDFTDESYHKEKKPILAVFQLDDAGIFRVLHDVKSGLPLVLSEK